MYTKMYKFKLYPNKRQKTRLFNSLKISKEIYNSLLELNRKILVTKKFDFNNLIMDLKCCHPELREIHSQVLQNIGNRVSKAFDNFFRKVKNREREKGCPRFKSKINSITYPQSGFKFLNERKLKVSKIGNVPIILHRVPKGKIKTLTIKVNKAGQWFACFSCEVPDIKVKNSSNKKIGIDVGLESFATLSNGTKVENPKYLIRSEKRLKKLQRKLSKKKLGSKNRKKFRLKLSKVYLKVSNQRNDFLHKISRDLVSKNSFIVVENLKIKNMVKNHYLAKSISDVSWGSFIQMLSYKAVTSGGMLIKVNPRNTSKKCSNCGTITELSLKKRNFSCPKCGFACHRDFNASLNILRQGLSEFTPGGDIVRPSLEKANVIETGTIQSNS